MFQDRLVNDEDRSWFKNQLQEKLVKSFSISYDEVVTREPLLYGDFMIPNAEFKQYGKITDDKKVSHFLLINWPYIVSYQYNSLG